jgi:hypothetical protein
MSFFKNLFKLDRSLRDLSHKSENSKKLNTRIQEILKQNEIAKEKFNKKLAPIKLEANKNPIVGTPKVLKEGIARKINQATTATKVSMGVK